MRIVRNVLLLALFAAVAMNQQRLAAADWPSCQEVMYACEGFPGGDFQGGRVCTDGWMEFTCCFNNECGPMSSCCIEGDCEHEAPPDCGCPNPAAC